MIDVGDKVKVTGNHNRRGHTGVVTGFWRLGVQPKRVQLLSGGYMCTVDFDDGKDEVMEYKLQKMEKNMDNLVKGDVLKSIIPYKSVLTVVKAWEDDIIFVTDDLNSLGPWLLEELKDAGYTVDNGVVEMTVAEIAAKLGHDVKVVK